MKSTEVTLAQARRIAVRAQLLDGSATDVLSTVRRLGFLQMDPISTVAPPQYLVLWSRLGRYDRAELDRLLWDEKKLFEWNAFIWPIEDLPLLRARMREPWGRAKWRQLAEAVPAGAIESAEVRAPRARTARADAVARARAPRRPCRRAHRLVGHPRPADVDAGAPPAARPDRRRRPAERPAALGSRGALVPGDGDGSAGRSPAAPPGEALPRARRAAREGPARRARRRGGRESRQPRHVPVPLRPPRARPQPCRGALGLLLPARDVRPEGEARVRLLRPPHPSRRPDHRPHRARLRPEDEVLRRRGRLRRARRAGRRRRGDRAARPATRRSGWARTRSRIRGRCRRSGAAHSGARRRGARPRPDRGLATSQTAGQRLEERHGLDVDRGRPARRAGDARTGSCRSSTPISSARRGRRRDRGRRERIRQLGRERRGLLGCSAGASEPTISTQ